MEKIHIFLNNNPVETNRTKREAFLQNFCYGIYTALWNLLQKYAEFNRPYKT